MRTYVAQAKNQIKQVLANAQADFHRVAEDAVKIAVDADRILLARRVRSAERSAAGRPPS